MSNFAIGASVLYWIIILVVIVLMILGSEKG